MIPYYQDPAITIYNGDAMKVLPGLPAQIAQTSVTSPPYWGLRDYGIDPSIWGGDPECQHVFEIEMIDTEIGRGNWTQAVNGRGENQGNITEFREPIRSTSDRGFCKKCGAWKGCYGLEPTPELYIEHTVQIFREVKRALKDDGILWLNLGDSYSHGGCGGRDPERWPKQSRNDHFPVHGKKKTFLKPKDLIGIPWRVALALQTDGWYLRSDIIWHKPNPMPESAKDRPTKAHEYIFLLSKSQRYYYDADAIKEKASPDTHARYARGRSNHHKWADGGPGNQTIAKSFQHMCKPGVNPKSMLAWKSPDGWDTSKGSGRHGTYHRQGREKGKRGLVKQNPSFSAAVKDIVEYRNKRSVWTIEDHNTLVAWLNQSHPEILKEYFSAGKPDVWTVSTAPYSEAHFATFPPELIVPCIKAGSREGDIVIDPFGGSVTTGYVAEKLGRKSILIDIKNNYCGLMLGRMKQPALL